MTEAKSTRNSGEEWTDDDIQQLRELAEGNTPTGVISIRLGRGEEAVRAKAQAEETTASDSPLRVVLSTPSPPHSRSWREIPSGEPGELFFGPGQFQRYRPEPPSRMSTGQDSACRSSRRVRASGGWSRCRPKR
jgi:hypothetical protein